MNSLPVAIAVEEAGVQAATITTLDNARALALNPATAEALAAYHLSDGIFGALLNSANSVVPGLAVEIPPPVQAVIRVLPVMR